MLPKKGIIVLTSVFVLITLAIVIAGGIKHDRDYAATTQELAETRKLIEGSRENFGGNNVIAISHSNGEDIIFYWYMHDNIMEDKKIWLDHTYDFLLAAPEAIPVPLLLIFFAWRRQG